MTARTSLLAVLAVSALGAINLVRGSIHVFAPDGGAVSIAGLDIGGAPQTILFLFASIGVGQIGLGLVDAAAVLRWRRFVTPLVFIHLAQTALGVFVLFVLKPPPTEVPGQWFNLGLLAALAAIALLEGVRMARRER